MFVGKVPVTFARAGQFKSAIRIGIPISSHREWSETAVAKGVQLVINSTVFCIKQNTTVSRDATFAVGGWLVSRTRGSRVSATGLKTKVFDGFAAALEIDYRLTCTGRTQVIAVSTFLAGAALTAIGVWSSTPLTDAQLAEKPFEQEVSAEDG